MFLRPDEDLGADVYIIPDRQRRPPAIHGTFIVHCRVIANDDVTRPADPDVKEDARTFSEIENEPITEQAHKMERDPIDHMVEKIELKPFGESLPGLA